MFKSVILSLKKIGSPSLRAFEPGTILKYAPLPPGCNHHHLHVIPIVNEVCPAVSLTLFLNTVKNCPDNTSDISTMLPYVT